MILVSSLIRTSAFVRKEIVEIVRQPRLLLTLVLGPFFILLAFGIGYRNEGRTLRALVVTKNKAMLNGVQQYAPRLGPQLVLEESTTNLNEAREKLKRSEVDVLIVLPDDPPDTRSGEQAAITVMHNEVDPYQTEYVKTISQLYTDKLNRWVLSSSVESGKSRAASVRLELKDTIDSLQQLKTALNSKEASSVQQSEKHVGENILKLEQAIRQGVREAAPHLFEPGQVQEVLDRSESVRKKTETLVHDEQRNHNEQDRAAMIQEIESELNVIESRLSDVASVNTRSLFSPFSSKALSVAGSAPTLSQFFIPGVLVLLLQHLAISFAGLSIVREFRTGAAELFHVSPMKPFELLAGKYAGYFIIGGMLVAALTLSFVYGLRMPMLGRWHEYALILSVLLFASLGYGFLFSLLSSSESQAIQYTMIFLLLSIFFSGFMLHLDLLWRPVRLLSYILPASYGIRLMQDNMLRGDPLHLPQLSMMAALGIGLLVVSYRLLRRRFS